MAEMKNRPHVVIVGGGFAGLDAARALASAALDVTFLSGRRYRYFLVPGYIARGLAEAFSKGRYFNARIRDNYPFEELPTEEGAIS